jgi:hypothetical protein
MNRIPRLLCLTALAGSTAFAQTTAGASLPSDPTLASEHIPGSYSGEYTVSQAKPSAAHAAAQSPAMPSAAIQSDGVAGSPYGESQLQATAIPPTGPQLQPRANGANTVLPVATVLRLKLERPISTATARRGEKFFATLSRPVVVDGRTIIPSGTSITCRVDGFRAGRRIGGKPWLAIRAVSVQLSSGEVLQFTASVIDSTNPHKFDVDQEGRVRGTTFSPMDKIETGALAGTGLIAGAVIAGGPAAILIGAASGAAVGAGHTLIKHKDLTLASGTELIFQLDAPATVHSQIEAAM